MEPVPQDLLPDAPLRCARCDRELAATARFCNGCGHVVQQNVPAPYVDEGFMRRQRDLIAVFAVVLLYILGAYLMRGERSWQRSLGWDAGLFVIVLAASVYFRTVLLPALTLGSFSVRRLFGYLAAQGVLTAFVLLTVSWFRHSVGEASSSWAVYAGAPWPAFVALLSMAVAPAISEELAFRGILFGQLRTLTSATSTVLVTSFLFALVHFSFLSLFWLVPAGLYYGWVRDREGVIWYGVACHFAHNATVVLGEARGWW